MKLHARSLKLSVVCLIATCLCAICFLLVACNDDASHVHDLGEWKIDLSTCTEDGACRRCCSSCDYVEEIILPKLPHTYDDNETDGYEIAPATCKEEGIKRRACLVCDEVEEVVSSKLPHTLVIDEAQEASCTETGLTAGVHCSVCNDVILGQTVAPKIPHVSVTDVAVDPTFERDGLTEGSHCEICGQPIIAQKVIERLKYEDFSYKVNFATDEHVQIIVYNTQDYIDGAVTNIAYSRNADSGELVMDGDGQVNFSVEYEDGYEAYEGIEITPASGYNKLKFIGTDGNKFIYRITKISAPLKVNIHSKTSVDPQTSDLPIFIISTCGSAEILDKEIYVDCKVSVTNTGDTYCFENIDAGIRGRGNSSWVQPKKPYKLKFDSAVNLFDNGAAKKWTLIANYTDPSLIRNYLAYSVGSLFPTQGITTSVRFVELYLNGSYEGIYLVCEQVETGKNRVDIDESLDGVDTGYLLEMDFRARYEGVLGVDWFQVNGIPYVIKTPDVENSKVTSEFLNFIQTSVQNAVNALNSNDYDSVKQLIDVESFAESYIVHELFNCVDVGFSSFYIYKDAGGKIKSGPLWDFDLSSGNCDDSRGEVQTPECIWGTTNEWYRLLLRYDEFKDIVIDKLNEYKVRIADKIDDCVSYVIIYADEFERNFERWDSVLGQYVWENSQDIVDITTWRGQVDYLHTWLLNSLEYLSKTVYCVDSND